MAHPSHPTVRVTRRLAATPERVFDAWLDPAKARQFLFATPTGEMVRCDIDARAGGRYVIVERRDGEDVAHVGEYCEIDRPLRLVFTLQVPKYSETIDRITLADVRRAVSGRVAVCFASWFGGAMVRRSRLCRAAARALRIDLFEITDGFRH